MAREVAQVVEQWHSVRAGRVRFPEHPGLRSWLFCRAFFLSIKVISFFFPISYHQQCLYIFTQKIREYTEKGAGYGPYLRKSLIDVKTCGQSHVGLNPGPLYPLLNYLIKNNKL